MDKIIEPVPVTPKYVPFKCVVCNGFGTVSREKNTCHACEGRGYILVEASEASRKPKLPPLDPFAEKEENG